MKTLEDKIAEFCDLKTDLVKDPPKNDMERGFKTATILLTESLKHLVTKHSTNGKK